MVMLNDTSEGAWLPLTFKNGRIHCSYDQKYKNVKWYISHHNDYFISTLYVKLILSGISTRFTTY